MKLPTRALSKRCNDILISLVIGILNFDYEMELEWVKHRHEQKTL